MKRSVLNRKNRDNALNKNVKKVDPSVEILGIKIIGTQMSQVLKKMWLQRKEMLHIVTVNPEYIMEAQTNEAFRKVLESCLSVADGHGVLWANRISNHKFSNSQMGTRASLERISGTQLVSLILEHASQNDEKVFLLGAGPGIAELAAREMSKKYPSLQIYCFEGAKTVQVEKNEEASMTIAKINGISPDYLLVAYGSPYQDLWIEENRPYLRVRVAIGIGGALDEWAGKIKLCPDWIDQIGMKWLWRVVHEPWRWRRIVRIFHFGILVLYHKLID